MKKLNILFFSLLVVALFLQSCDDNKSYAELLKEERNLIKRFMSEHDVKVISLKQFQEQDSMTYENQYLDFSGEGVYMHIDHEASGDDARFAETNDLILVRFLQINLSSNDTISSHENIGYLPDEFRYTKSGTTILGKFVGGGLMQYLYGQSVPAGWLMPLNYLKLSDSNGSNRTKIRLLVSAKNGQSDAINNIYPCYYELTYQFPK